MATIPGAEGKFGMLPGHAPFVSTLKAGIITFNPESPTPTRFAVLDGVVEIAPARCTVLAETAESLEGMTANKARAQLEAARQTVETATSVVKRRAAVNIAHGGNHCCNHVKLTLRQHSRFKIARDASI